MRADYLHFAHCFVSTCQSPPFSEFRILAHPWLFQRFLGEDCWQGTGYGSTDDAPELPTPGKRNLHILRCVFRAAGFPGPMGGQFFVCGFGDSAYRAGVATGWSRSPPLPTASERPANHLIATDRLSAAVYTYPGNRPSGVRKNARFAACPCPERNGLRRVCPVAPGAVSTPVTPAAHPSGDSGCSTLLPLCFHFRPPNGSIPKSRHEPRSAGLKTGPPSQNA